MTQAQPDRARTAAAIEACRQYAADRAIDDPERLARAARIVRTALERGRITMAELESPAKRKSA